MMISFLQRINEDHGYALQVLLPEFIELLLINRFTISKEEARQYMLGGGIIHIMEESCPTFKASGKVRYYYKI